MNFNNLKKVDGVQGASNGFKPNNFSKGTSYKPPYEKPYKMNLVHSVWDVSPEGLATKMNAFRRTHKGSASQTHVMPNGNFVAFMYYEADS
jgi:hypothetical protein